MHVAGMGQLTPPGGLPGGVLARGSPQNVMNDPAVPKRLQSQISASNPNAPR